MKLFRKAAAGFMVLTMTAGTVCLPVYAEETAQTSTEDNAEFDAFLTQEFVDMVSEDYLTLHFTLENPEAYGIEIPDPALDPDDIGNYAEAIEEAQASLDQLHSFDYNTLSDRQQHDYDAYEMNLEQTIELNKYENYDWYFEPGRSLYDDLTTNLTEFVFRSADDFADYLTYVHSIPAYLEKALEVTEQQAKAGYFMTDNALAETIEALDEFAAKTDENPLIVLFDEKADAFERLSDTKREALKQENREAVLNEIIPVYTECSQTLQSLSQYCTTEDNFASMDGWTDYYAVMARSYTSTTKNTTVQQMIDECETYLADIVIPAYVEVVNNKDLKEAETLALSDPVEILEDLSQHLEDYPEIGEISYQIKYLDPSVANDAILAYYLDPPIDNAAENQIKINGENITDTNELYQTLAHEGLPGHMLQENYYLSTDPNELRTQLGTLGYMEGWAMYTETDAMMTSGLSELFAEYYSLESALNYVLDTIADLGVNGLGWTSEELGDELYELGLDDDDFAASLHEWVTENPGMIISYGYGLTEMMLIREDAKEALGSSFNLKEFNTVILNNGPRSFDSVRSDVNNWVKSQGGSAIPDGHSSSNKGISKKLVVAGTILLAGAIVIAGLFIARRFRKKKTLKDHEA